MFGKMSEHIMDIITHEVGERKVAELHSEKILIGSLQEGIDLIGNLYYQGFDCAILYAKNLPAEFFDLKTKFAGEILQKFTTYRIRLAIVGDFSVYDSKSMRDFIFESNKGRQVNFVDSLEEALRML